MALSDPVDIMLAHMAWANRGMMEACAKLPEESFHRKFEMGVGTLHDTITHILAATRGWGELLAGRESRPRLEGTKRTIAELQGLLEEVTQEFAEAARVGALEEVVSRERGGKVYRFTRGAVMTHVATHAMHHRAQMLNMLRQMGVTPLPQSSVMEWTWTE